MKGYVCLCVLLFACTLYGQDPVAPEPDEQVVLQMERQWLKASQQKDPATLDRIVADDFTGIGPGGNLITKNMILVPPDDSGPTPFEHSRLSEMTVKIFGDSAVVFGRLAGFDTENPHEVRFTMVYAKRKGGWQMIAAQLVPVRGT